MVEAEVDEPAEVERGEPGGEPLLVAVHAAVADLAVPAGDEPGDGAFDHGPVLSVVVEHDRVAPRGAGVDQLVVVFADVDLASGLGVGASAAERAVGAAPVEVRVAARCDRDGVPGRAGDSAGMVIDPEVVAGEATLDGGLEGHRLDHRLVASLADLGSCVARAVGGVGVDLEAGFLAVEERDAGRAVGDIARGERAVGHQPGVGLNRDVGLVAVAVGIRIGTTLAWRWADGQVLALVSTDATTERHRAARDRRIREIADEGMLTVSTVGRAVGDCDVGAHARLIGDTALVSGTQRLLHLGAVE